MSLACLLAIGAWEVVGTAAVDKAAVNKAAVNKAAVNKAEAPMDDVIDDRSQISLARTGTNR